MRPSVADINDETDSIEFMQFEINSYKNSAEHHVVRLFGVTEAGNTVCADFHKFGKFFYILVTDNDVEISDYHMEQLRENMNDSVGDKYAFTKITMCKRGKSRFLRVFYSHDSTFDRVREVFEAGLPHIGSPKKDCLAKSFYNPEFVSTELEFMMVKKLVGMSWVRIAAGNWNLRQESEKQTHCQIEIDVFDFEDMIVLPLKGKHSKIAPLRILSFDLECLFKGKNLPDSEHDPII